LSFSLETEAAERDATIRSFKHPLVRALAWTIGSPTLFNPARPEWKRGLADDAQGAQWLTDALPWLRMLEERPGELERLLPPAQKRPLGKSFELLVGHWLGQRADIAWIQPSLVVRRFGRTMGEFDHVYATKDGALNSLELTVKFYLRVAPERGAYGYVGPMVFDFMAQKIARMTSHQMPLGDTEDGQAAIRALLTRLRYPHDSEGVLPVRAHAISRGILFDRFDAPAPDDVSPGYARGSWCLADQVHAQADASASVWKPLDNLEWLGAQRASARELMPLNVCLNNMGKTRHVMVGKFVPDVATAGEAFEETERMMILSPEASVLKLDFSK
jgi:uncharacterized protein